MPVCYRGGHTVRNLRFTLRADIPLSVRFRPIADI
jgi:hypothetical protein